MSRLYLDVRESETTIKELFSEKLQENIPIL